jgi:protein TonB
MIAYNPFARARLTVSAAFSIALHALALLIMSSTVLFPRLVPTVMHSLEVIIASNPAEQAHNHALLKADKAQAGERITDRPKESSYAPARDERRLQTQGNAQWAVKPGFQDNTARQHLQQESLRHRTISAATHEARDAAYLARWRDRVERLGTAYYQSKIRQTPLSGEVRLLVSIGPEGQLLEVAVRQSSGQPALDAMALEILRQSAPFEPLPQEIRTDTDVLEIIRTWKFTAQTGTMGE